MTDPALSKPENIFKKVNFPDFKNSLNQSNKCFGDLVNAIEASHLSEEF